MIAIACRRAAHSSGVAVMLGGGEPEPEPEDGVPVEELLLEVPDDVPPAGWFGVVAAGPGAPLPPVAAADPPGTPGTPGEPTAAADPPGAPGAAEEAAPAPGTAAGDPAPPAAAAPPGTVAPGPALVSTPPAAGAVVVGESALSLPLPPPHPAKARPITIRATSRRTRILIGIGTP